MNKYRFGYRPEDFHVRLNPWDYRLTEVDRTIIGGSHYVVLKMEGDPSGQLYGRHIHAIGPKLVRLFRTSH